MSTPPLHIGIAGAGLLGRLLAWKLLQQGHKVSLYDKGSRVGEGSAARVAASMLAPYTEVVHAERQVFDWGLMALGWWPEQLARLNAETGLTIDHAINGSVAVAHELDKSSMTHFYQSLKTLLPDRLQHVRQLDRQQLAALEPELAEGFQQGLYLAEEGYLDNWALLSALNAAIDRLGGEFVEYAEIHDIRPEQLAVGHEQRQFDWVVDSRGIGAKSALPKLRGVRGEILWVHAPEVQLSRPVRLMHPRYKLYISPRPNRHYVIGATEIESESMAPVTVRSSLELLSALYSVHSGFAEAKVEHSFAHCRPAMPDNLPVIDVQPGLITVNGLYRHGYLLSPYVVEKALASFADFVV